MNLLFLPTFLGLSIEVYFILLILGIPIFFLCNRVLKKFVKVRKTRKIWAWLSTIILTPAIYVGIVTIWFFSMSYYPSRKFDKQQWFADKETRYQLSGDLLKSKILIGKSKPQVRELLGDEADNQDNSDEWEFELGTRPGFANIDPDYLELDFKNGKVIAIEQHRR